MVSTTERLILRALLPLFAAVLLVFLGGCGDDADEQAPPPFAGKDEGGGGGSKKALKKKVKKRGKRKGGMSEDEYIAKPEWDMLAAHFFKYAETLEEDVHSQSVVWKYKDAFADRVEKFYPPAVEEKKSAFDLAKAGGTAKDPAKKKEERTIESILEGIIPPSAEGDEDTLVEKIDDGPREPLMVHTLDKYVFRIIMTGVANPEAVVEDPDGMSYVVHLNDKLGSEGGYIEEIFRHKVLVRLPDNPEPVAVTLAPTSLPDSFAHN
jgi:hypothetical protein